MTNDARTQAFFLLNKLDQGKFTLDYYLDELDRKNVLADKRERGLFNALMFGVLRQKPRLDYVLKHFASQPLNKLDYEVRNVLRLALYQIMFMDRVPASAAVNTAVEIAKKYKPKAAGFVNAVLRKAAVGYTTVDEPDKTQNPVLYHSVKYGLPQWLVSRWLKRFNENGLAFVCRNMQEIPPLGLKLNPAKTDMIALTAQLADYAESVSPGDYSAQALRLSKPKVPVFELPGFTQGYFMVQDEAAQLPVALLAAQPNETVLDVCAGIGGKTVSMALSAENRIQILATDQSFGKLEQLRAETARLGINMPEILAVDWLKPLPEIKARLTGNLGKLRLFDKVLVDAPCSGLGVLRRNPDTRWTRKEKDLAAMQKRQLAILHNASHFVKPGGIMVYTVCSAEPEETTGVTDAFLENNPQFIADDNVGNLSADFCEKTGLQNGGFCTYPAYNDMDGFFMARFKLTA